MIHIEKGQSVAENTNLRVLTTTGDYEDSALIECYDLKYPDITAGSFQAQYIKYGSLVYQFNSPKDLGEAILKIDPESTHTAASFVRMTNALLAQMTAGTLEAQSLDQVVATEQAAIDEQRTTPLETETENATSTPAVSTEEPTVDDSPTNTETATTTPQVNTNQQPPISNSTPLTGSTSTSTDSSSTTPQLFTPTSTESSTTTPQINISDSVPTSTPALAPTPEEVLAPNPTPEAIVETTAASVTPAEITPAPAVPSEASADTIVDIVSEAVDTLSNTTEALSEVIETVNNTAAAANP